MSLDLQGKSYERMRVLVVILIALVVGLLGVLVGIMFADNGEDEKGSHEAKASESVTPSPSHTEDDDTYKDPQKWVKLPKGKDEENGLPVKFPPTARGAAAVAVNVNRNGWTWDTEQIRNGIKTYMVDSHKKDALGTSEYSARSARKEAGVPEKGPVPDGASIKGQPVGVQWNKVKKGHYRIFVLTRVTSKSGAYADAKTNLFSMPGEAVWEDGDWKGVPLSEGDASDAPEPAEIGSEEFYEHGWRVIQEGGDESGPNVWQ